MVNDSNDKPKKWDKNQFFKHIQNNSDYSSSIIIAALYKKIYGDYPKIGLSGYQASAVECILEVLPDEAS